jgi:hypothetical protein
MPTLIMNFHSEKWTHESYEVEKDFFNQIVELFKKDVYRDTNRDEIMGDIFHLQENFDCILSRLHEAQEPVSNSQHPNKSRFGQVTTIRTLLV